MKNKTHLPLVLGLVLMMTVLVSLSVARLSAPPSGYDLERLGVVEFDSPREFTWQYFVDESGDVFDKDEFLDRWTLVFFGFTNCPDICPATMSVFSKMARQLESDSIKEDTRYLMISVDPKRDSIARLGSWLGRYGYGLKGVRGEVDAMQAVARDFSVGIQKDGQYSETNIYHSAQVFLVGPDAKQHAFVRAAINADNLERAYRSVRKRYELGS